MADHIIDFEGKPVSIKEQIEVALYSGNEKLQVRRQNACNLFLMWAKINGKFVYPNDKQLYYYYNNEESIYQINSLRWKAWLSNTTGLNMRDPSLKYITDACVEETINRGKNLPVLRVAYYDSEQQELRISNFAGKVYVLDGDSVKTELNGEQVLFLDNVQWEPYKPDYNKSKNIIDLITKDYPNWAINRERAAFIFRVWILSTFFTEIHPTRPLLVLQGEKGSGKSLILRLLLKYIFGGKAELEGVPDKKDGFTAYTSNAHIIAIDNMDSYVGWLQDKLARLSTGAEDSFRQLYTTNELVKAKYRCWAALTARTPQTLQRDDLVDRSLILPLHRLDKNGIKAEREFIQEAMILRNQFWGVLFNEVNLVVKALREKTLNSNSSLRMADFGSFGAMIAEIHGLDDKWPSYEKSIQLQQTAFLLEDEPISLAFEALQGHYTYSAADKRTAKELFEVCTIIVNNQDVLTTEEWYKTPQSFAKKLANIRNDLLVLFPNLRWERGAGAKRERLVYWLEKK